MQLSHTCVRCWRASSWVGSAQLQHPCLWLHRPLLQQQGLSLYTEPCARWIAWLGIASGAILVLTTGWIALGQQWLHNAGVIGLLGFLFWSAASSISLLRTKSYPVPGYRS